ncbi:uncharacterized protein [Montipora foliosa]|uniref:uncharacterized protein n=1 Tax=Montipora foliosa TaxID=591990 RepID=UPI0035F1DF2F
MMDGNWSEWSFVQFLEALEKWTINNPISEAQRPKVEAIHNNKREKTRVFYAKRDDGNQTTARGCLFCERSDHKAIDCDKVVSVEQRKKIFLDKRLCFNCTGSRHRAEDCRSKSTCQNCHARHHTSLCDRVQARKPGMTANNIGNTAVIHPVVVVKIGGYKFRALLDSGASHSYASSTAIDLINARPKSTGLRQIAMLTGITTRTMQVFGVVISSVQDEFKLEVDITKVNKRELLVLENPRYKEILEANSHLNGVRMDDDDIKDRLPVHIILGANDFAKIRTGERLRVGRRGDPVAEFTRFGWTIMSPGADRELATAYLAINSNADYERLCALDVLGLADSSTGDQGDVYEEFKEQLVRSSEGWYETGLPWKGSCPPLPNNRDGSLRRLNTLVRKLRRTDMLDDYDAVIREQLREGVVEPAPAEVTGREFYLPHRAVVRRSAETTKLRVVYDASARAQEKAPSLNECLHVGPPLHNKLWSVIVRNRFHPMAVAGDLRCAFLQVRIRETERDSLRFHWIADKTGKQVETLRFTRLVFGLAPSPFLLNGVIQQHLENMQSRYPDSVNEIRRSLYVDDLISGGPTSEKAKRLKREATEIFANAKFELHKWHSNEKQLETSCEDYEPSFAKEQLENGTAAGECKLLGLGWDKVQDTLHVSFPELPAEETNRGILANLAKVYDPLGIVSPVMLEGKVLYRESCIQKNAWDAPLPDDLERKEMRKAYVVLCSCSLTRGVFLELLPNLETGEFIKSLKHFIARRGRPSRVYSDNGQAFVAAAKWLKKVQKDEEFHSFLSNQSIIWQFNLSRAPWWGGQFERLIGLMKSAFYKTVGQGILNWEELSEVILDIEVTMNNRPLCYQEEDVQLPTLTPNTMLFLKSNILPELQPYHLEERDLRKRAKFLQKTKDAIWNRWTAEYLRALRERHRLKLGDKRCSLAVGDVVIIRSSERKRNSWPLGIVESLIEGRDGVVRGARLRAGRSHIERPIQHLYPLELSCDRDGVRGTTTTLDPGAPAFRPRRDAAVAAELRVQDLAQEHQWE